MFKNVAGQKIIFIAYDTTTGLLKTGDAANLTAYVSKDIGAVTVLADTSAAEMSSTNAKGCYTFDLAQDETNADMALYTCKSSTANIQLDPVFIFTTAPSSNANVAQTGDNYARLGAPAGASHAADTAAVKTDTAAIKTKTDSLTFTVAGQVDANTLKVGGTTQTARDLGASVLLSAGTGAGQLDFTSGVVKANLAQILGTALTETAGLLAGGFKKFFNVASPTLTCLGVDQTGDSYARLGAPAGASVSADTAAVKTDTAAVKVQTDKLTFTVANQIDANVLDWKSATAPAMTGDAYARIGAAGAGLTALGDTRIANLDAAVSSRSTFAGGAVASVTADVGITQAAADKVWGSATRTLTSFGTLVADAATAVWAAATRVLTAGTNIVLAKGTGVTGFNDLDAAGTRGAVGLAAANLDTQIATLATAAVAALIKAKTDNLPASPAAVSDIPTSAQIATAVLTTAMTESYAADGVAPTLAQSQFMLLGSKYEFTIAGDVLTVKKLDGATTAMTFTLSPPGGPYLSITRAS